MLSEIMKNDKIPGVFFDQFRYSIYDFSTKLKANCKDYIKQKI